MLGSYFGRPRVLLVQPNGLWAKPLECDRAWQRRDWHCDRRKTQLVDQLERRSGSLVDAFNSLWAAARNFRDRGQADFMGMCHADIEPGSWWVDDLLAEMRRYGASVCSAVVPIKDHRRQLTSAAIGQVNDPYANRCLSFKELDTLPETFCSEQVCRPGELLLVNTGLWICDLHQSWVDEWVFPQSCRIEHRDGAWHSDLLTEDWEMSRFLHKQGVHYICTRKVVTRHWGMDYWESGPKKRDFSRLA